MIGPFLNALGILLGSLFGLVRREPLAPRTQKACQSALGAATAFGGLQLVWLNVGGTFRHVAAQLAIAVVSVVAGNILGRLLRLQKLSNRIGRAASARLEAARPGSLAGSGDGLLAVTMLFCAAPLGIVGAVTEGLGNGCFPLAVKAAMDGLAMTSFVKMFRWPVALAALPVCLFLDGLALVAHDVVLPRLLSADLLHAIGASAGLVVVVMTLVVLELRRVELANFLPALVVAPLLTKLLL